LFRAESRKIIAEETAFVTGDSALAYHEHSDDFSAKCVVALLLLLLQPVRRTINAQAAALCRLVTTCSSDWHRVCRNVPLR
jgi:hypothetical protein